LVHYSLSKIKIKIKVAFDVQYKIVVLNFLLSHLDLINAGLEPTLDYVCEYFCLLVLCLYMHVAS